MFDKAPVKLLLYIYKSGGVIENFRETMLALRFSSSRLDRARRILKEYGLIREKKISGTPVILRIELLEKGFEVAKYLERILSLIDEENIV